MSTNDTSTSSSEADEQFDPSLLRMEGMRAHLKKQVNDDEEAPPSLEELLVISVRQTLELADRLGMSFDELVRTLKLALEIEKERTEAMIAQERSNKKEPRT